MRCHRNRRFSLKINPPISETGRALWAARLFLPVKTLISPRSIQGQALAWRRAGTRVVLVPTMGALHAGHVALIRRARKLAGDGAVVVSIYVNPAQFNDAGDLRRYPRPLAADKRLCRAEGVDMVFNPRTLYADDASVMVEETAVSRGMEGTARPGHFRGVATVVVKLFNLVLPDVAVFGEKDFQQSALIQRVVRDLNLPVRVVVASTVREPDGLACSSRNELLTLNERKRADVLWQTIRLARRSVRDGDLHGLRYRLKKLIEKQPDTRVDYMEFFDEHTLRSVLPGKGVRLALAVYVGKTRLIDNGRL